MVSMSSTMPQCHGFDGDGAQAAAHGSWRIWYVCNEQVHPSSEESQIHGATYAISQVPSYNGKSLTNSKKSIILRSL